MKRHGKHTPVLVSGRPWRMSEQVAAATVGGPERHDVIERIEVECKLCSIALKGLFLSFSVFGKLSSMLRLSSLRTVLQLK